MNARRNEVTSVTVTQLLSEASKAQRFESFDVIYGWQTWNVQVHGPTGLVRVRSGEAGKSSQPHLVSSKSRVLVNT